MPTEEPLKKRKLPLFTLCILAFAARGRLAAPAPRRERARACGAGDGVIRDAGPWVYFAATAFLPAVGAPLSAFTIVAGRGLRRADDHGAGVIAAALAAIAANLALTYWLARYALRPMLSRFTERYGYRIPRVTRDNALNVALVIRLTPGPPFFMQSYMLGLAEVPFRLYMIVSWLCILPWAVAFVVLGKGVFNGNFKLVMTGVGRPRGRDGAGPLDPQALCRPRRLSLGRAGPRGPAADRHRVHPPGEGGPRGGDGPLLGPGRGVQPARRSRAATSTSRSRTPGPSSRRSCSGRRRRARR